MMLKQEMTKKIVYEPYESKKARGLNFTIDHFNAEIIPKRSLLKGN